MPSGVAAHRHDFGHPDRGDDFSRERQRHLACDVMAPVRRRKRASPTTRNPASAASSRAGSISTGCLAHCRARRSRPARCRSRGSRPRRMRAQHRDAGVVAPRAGAADRDDGVGLFVGKRAFERAHEDHVGAVRRDAARDRQRGRRRRRIETTRTRGSRTRTREMPTACNAATSTARNLSPASRNGRSGAASAPAASTPSPAVAAACASAPLVRHGVRRQHRIGIARHRGARIDPLGRWIERHRRIRPGIRDLLGTHRPPIDERDRCGGRRLRDTSCASTRPSASASASSRGATGCAIAATRASTSRDRRQAQDALRGHPDCVREGSRIGQAAKRKIAKGYGPSGANALDARHAESSIAPRCLTPRSTCAGCAAHCPP